MSPDHILPPIRSGELASLRTSPMPWEPRGTLSNPLGQQDPCRLILSTVCLPPLPQLHRARCSGWKKQPMFPSTHFLPAQRSLGSSSRLALYLGPPSLLPPLCYGHGALQEDSPEASSRSLPGRTGPVASSATTDLRISKAFPTSSEVPSLLHFKVM